MISLEEIDQVIQLGPLKLPGPLLAIKSVQIGIGDAKFGIFIHWGVYSVPAFCQIIREICISRNLAMTIIERILRLGWGFGCCDLIPLFTADRFDPASWLDLFKKRSPVSFSISGAPRWFSDVCLYSLAL